jgi:hypothetical protein
MSDENDERISKREVTTQQQPVHDKVQKIHKRTFIDVHLDKQTTIKSKDRVETMGYRQCRFSSKSRINAGIASRLLFVDSEDKPQIDAICAMTAANRKGTSPELTDRYHILE